MHKNAALYISTLILLLSIWSWGCGQQQGGGNTPTGPVSIRGNLNGGTINSRELRVAGAAALGEVGSPLAGYTIVAIGTRDKKVYFPDASTSGSGVFTISNLPEGESFYLGIIDENNQFVAAVAFGSSIAGVIMAITPEAGSVTIDLGQVIYDSSEKSGVTSQEITSILDMLCTAEAMAGEIYIPTGAENKGKGTSEAYLSGTLVNAVDEDRDGWADVADADDNGNNVTDFFDDDPRVEGAKEFGGITGVNNVNIFSDIPIDYRDYASYVDGVLNTTPLYLGHEVIYCFEVVMAAGYTPGYFSDIRVTEGSAWLETSTIYDPTTPVETLWSSTNYQLSQEDDRWSVHIRTNAATGEGPAAGDIIKFRATTASGGAEQYFIFTLSSHYTSIPKLVAYVDDAGTKSGADLNSSVYAANDYKFNFTGSQIILKWIAPCDDLGIYLSNVDWYLDGITYTRSDGSEINVGSLHINDDVTSVFDAALGTVVYSYTMVLTTEAFSYFKVDVKAVSGATGSGSRSGAFQSIQFKKN